MHIQRILVPVDGSHHSSNATEHAADLAKLSGAEVLLLHCHRPVPAFLGTPNVQDATDQMAERSETVIAPYLEQLEKAGVAYRYLIVGGETAEIIADVALGEECDIIVMGSKGKSDLEGLFLGSVTHKVLNLVRTPVLVVH